MFSFSAKPEAKTVASVLANLNNIVADLQEVSASAAAEIEQCDAAIAAAQADKAKAQAEISQADTAAKNIRALLGL